MRVVGPVNLFQHGPRWLWISTLRRTEDTASAWRRWTMGANATSGTQHAVHHEMKRSGCLGVDCFQVAVGEGAKTPQRQSLQRMARFNACGTEANLLGNQQ